MKIQHDVHKKSCNCSYCGGRLPIHYGLNLPELWFQWNSWLVFKYWANRYIRFTLGFDVPIISHKYRIAQLEKQLKNTERMLGEIEQQQTAGIPFIKAYFEVRSPEITGIATVDVARVTSKNGSLEVFLNYWPSELENLGRTYKQILNENVDDDDDLPVKTGAEQKTE